MTSFVEFLRDHFADHQTTVSEPGSAAPVTLTQSAGRFDTGQRTTAIRRPVRPATPPTTTTAAAIAPNVGPAATPTPAGPIAGDVNSDGVVNADDLALFDRGLMKYQSGAIGAGTATLADGDVTLDGIVDDADYLAICTAMPGSGDGPGGPGGIVTAPVLIPGTGFTGPTEQPAAAGTSNQAGYDAKVIARWDVVPYQTFDGLFNVGVVAFHMNGIDRVEFSANGGEFVPVRQMTLNPQTANHSGVGNYSDGVFEYWVTLDASKFSQDGPVEVRAVAYPTVGEARVLDNLTLFANGAGSLAPGKPIYVSAENGSDTNGTGTSAAPFATLGKALRTVPDGGVVEILSAGRYVLGLAAKPDRVNQRWITVRSAAELNPEDVQIEEDPNDGSFRMVPRVHRLRWEGITFDFAKIGRIWGLGAMWFDQSKWTYSGWQTVESYATPVRDCPEGVFVTNSLAEDAVYGFVNVDMVRNSHVQRVGGDVYQNSKMVISSTASDVDGTVTAHHTDLYQMWGAMENTIVYGLKAERMRNVQTFFLEPTYESSAGSPQYALQNTAFIDVYSESLNSPDSAPYSQLISQFRHVLFRNVRVPNQRIMLRDLSPPHNQAWLAQYLVFENCEFYNFTGTTRPGVIVR